MRPILECESIQHRYGTAHEPEVVLRDVSVCFSSSDAVVLMGPSGSGKTTLLSILGCLLTPSGGRLLIEGREVDFRTRGRLCTIRREMIGFVFQHSQLLPFLTAEENLEVVGRNAGMTGIELVARIDALLDRLEIDAIRCKRPDQISGGQRQRVAIARALLTSPPILLADEPTASLDWHHGEIAVRLLVEQARAEGAFLLTVTHDARLLPFFNRQLRMDRGRLMEVRDVAR